MVIKIILLSLLFTNVSSLAQWNESDAQMMEDAYLNWIKHMGAHKHFASKKAEESNLKPCLVITVSPRQGKGDFMSVQKAIDSVPEFNKCRAVISIRPGVYKEKVDIPPTKPYISLVGAGARKSIIQWDDTADRIGPDGKPLGTFASATVAVNAQYFIAKSITFKNAAPLPSSGALGKQAVALRISADKAAFETCSFQGAQDTLYDHIGRHYFRKCYIEGSIDFIFGNGNSFYHRCHLHAITNGFGALTAQKRESMLEETGFSFVSCKVTGSGALYLGRAWGTFSRVVFAYTYMDKIITPKGWYNWGDTNREMTVFYGQYKCSGPGADFAGRVSWSRELTPLEAMPFISLSFIAGHEWLYL